LSLVPPFGFAHAYGGYQYGCPSGERVMSKPSRKTRRGFNRYARFIAHEPLFVPLSRVESSEKSFVS
jgi:hypothetical protein